MTKKLSSGELDHLIAVFEATSASAERLRLTEATSIDLRTLSALRELKQARVDLQEWRDWLAGACV